MSDGVAGQQRPESENKTGKQIPVQPAVVPKPRSRSYGHSTGKGGLGRLTKPHDEKISPLKKGMIILAGLLVATLLIFFMMMVSNQPVGFSPQGSGDVNELMQKFAPK